MGKREVEKFPRKSRDFYGTVDPAAAEALAPFLAPDTVYVEPCAGDGSLIRLLASAVPPVACVAAYDIAPQTTGITQRNCLTLQKRDLYNANCFITNPPFDWKMLQPILDHLPTLLPTWLLLPADVMHNKRMSNYLDFCTDIVSVGRLYWFADEQGKNVKGVDNFVWFRFYTHNQGFTKFHPRQL